MISQRKVDPVSCLDSTEIVVQFDAKFTTIARSTHTHFARFLSKSPIFPTSASAIVVGLITTAATISSLLAFTFNKINDKVYFFYFNTFKGL